MSTTTVPTLTLEGARIALAAAEQRAKEIGVPMNIAIVDNTPAQFCPHGRRQAYVHQHRYRQSLHGCRSQGAYIRLQGGYMAGWRCIRHQSHKRGEIQYYRGRVAHRAGWRGGWCDRLQYRYSGAGRGCELYGQEGSREEFRFEGEALKVADL
jgi:hypothetical protein